MNILRTQTKPEKGFTLIELLLVVTLVAISIGLTGDILLSIVRSFNKTNAFNEVEQQGNFLGLKLEKELRNATNVVSPSESQISFDYEGDTVYYNVVAGDSIYRSLSGYSTNPDDALIATSDITNSPVGVKVTCDQRCFLVLGTSPQIVRLGLVLSQSTSGGVSYSGSIIVQTTIVIRNSY